MAKQLFTVTLPAPATLERAAERLGLKPGEIDEHFGLVLVDPGRDQYAIMIEESAAARLAGAEGVRGPYANPRIEPFGPP